VTPKIAIAARSFCAIGVVSIGTTRGSTTSISSPRVISVAPPAASTFRSHCVPGP
jgi:hypothetical protein